MAYYMRTLVSRTRKRYIEDGFNLDLSYIRSNMIAMGYPADGLEAVYRNSYAEVLRFLDSKHDNKYVVYNLCSEPERTYDISKFYDRVKSYPFADHNVPRLELIKQFCKDLDEWLSEDEDNVAAIHCKAGKGRTGVMICCYLLHKKECQTADDALTYYAERRTHDKKGITIPSQKRYVHYFNVALDVDLTASSPSLFLQSIRLSPFVSYIRNCCILVSQAEEHGTKKLLTLSTKENKGEEVGIRLATPLTLLGDIRIEFYSNSKMKKQDRMFQLWMNTRMLAGQISGAFSASLHDAQLENGCIHVHFKKNELDGLHKKKMSKFFPDNFEVALLLSTEEKISNNHVASNSN